MLVTDILEMDKKRSKVYLDGEFAFVLYKGELRDCGIKAGKELDDIAFAEITEKILPKRCKLRAMNLLQKKDYTEKQLRDKLTEGLYPAYVVDQAIDYVKSFRYLDDDRFVRDYINYHMATRSRTRILQDLLGKGIPKDMITSIMDELYLDEDENVELDQISQLIIKKHIDIETADFKEKQKFIAFLLRKGYKMSDISKVIGNWEE